MTARGGRLLARLFIVVIVVLHVTATSVLVVVSLIIPAAEGSP